MTGGQAMTGGPAMAGGPAITGGRRSGGTVPALWLACAVLVAGCTGGGHSSQSRSPSDRSAASPTAAAGPPSSALLVPAAATSVVEGETPQALSLALSRTLFRTAPVVVLTDTADMAAGGAEAARLGVPLLVQDPPAGSTDGAPTTAGAVSSAVPAGAVAAEVMDEIRRLHPAAVLAVGAGPAHLTGLPVPVRTDAAALPATTRPDPSGVTVLVHRDGSAAAAAAAVARAAGATVVPVRGDDPRADPGAVAALTGRSTGQPLVAAGTGFGPPARLSARVAVAATGRQLPGGGQVLFPGRRLVALYGTPGTPSLGVLGEQGLEASIARARRVAAPYRAISDVPVVPTFEILATVASGSPGRDGDYSNELDVDALRPWVERAGAAGLYVVLDLQPGRADFLTQARRYEPLLRLPYVGLALDPEWRLAPGQRPLQQIGSVGVAEVNGVLAWLAGLTAAQALPQKLVVLHQFRLSMLRDERALDTGHDELSLLIHMDGQGATGLKDATWAAVTHAAPPGVRFGWKNFYDEDPTVLSPAQTLQRRPTPVMVSYQ